MTAIEARLAGEWAQVRSLHAPEPDAIHDRPGKPGLSCRGCEPNWDVSWGASSQEWPCATARIVYTPAEIERETTPDGDPTRDQLARFLNPEARGWH